MEKNMMYEMSVGMYMRTLKNLRGILEKAAVFAAEKKVEDSVILDSRIAVDMFPLVRQIRIACDNAKSIGAQLAGVEIPVMADEEKTIEELLRRVDKTLAFLATLTPEQFNGAESRKIKLRYFKDKHFIGAEFLPTYGLPNFYFHVVTAYDILRSLGVSIGKGDFTGELPFRED